MMSIRYLHVDHDQLELGHDSSKSMEDPIISFGHENIYSTKN